MSEITVVDGAKWLDEDFGIIFESIRKSVETYASSMPRDDDAARQDQLLRQRNEKLAQLSGVMLATAVSVKEIIGK